MLRYNALHNAPEPSRHIPLKILDGAALLLIAFTITSLVMFISSCNYDPISPIHSNNTPTSPIVANKTNTYMALGITTKSHHYTVIQTPEVNVVGYYSGNKEVKFTYKSGEYSVSSFGCPLLKANTTLYIRKIEQYDNGINITNSKEYNSGENNFRNIQINKKF